MTIEVVLAPGDQLKVTLKDTDGVFTLEYGKNAVRIKSDLPDTNGRRGTIYEEKFGANFGNDAWGVKKAAPKTKLIPTHNAVRAWLDFTASAQFSLVRPTESGSPGNLPERGALEKCPANTILVLFDGRIRPGGLVPNATRTFVKSKGQWWPKPEDEPHTCHTNGSIEQMIRARGKELGYGIFHPR